jgi:hypothetical protein
VTIEQNEHLNSVLRQMNRARGTAKRAFKGQQVKLRQEFQVGIHKPNDLGSILRRGRLIAAAVKKDDNLPALSGKGWLAADTASLESAINLLDTTDDTQETTKTIRMGTTGGRNTRANDLYEALLTIQNAANLQWPNDNPANGPVRAEFRFGQFPPRAKVRAPGEPEEPAEPPQP